MKTITTLIAGACASLALSAPALAQDDATFSLPDRCSDTPVSQTHGARADGAMADHDGHDMTMDMGETDMDGMGMDGMGADADAAMPEHIRQNMQKMLLTMPAMHRGMMQEDADIAFACGMIAHHQAAIDMAQVVLDHGQDGDMRSLAEEIIETQAQEIEFMTEWLDNAAD